MASPAAKSLGAEKHHAGRVKVQADLTVPAIPMIATSDDVQRCIALRML